MDLSGFLSFLSAVLFGTACGLLFFFIADNTVRRRSAEKLPDAESRRQLPLFCRVLLPLSVYLRPAAERDFCRSFREVYAVRLSMAGLGDVLTAADFTGIRICCIIIAVICTALGAAGGNIAAGLLIGIMAAVYPGVWLNGVVRRRHKSMLKSLPNMLDLLTLSVEAGRDLMSGLQDILQRRGLDPLGEELMRTFHEIQLGRRRQDALRSLSDRVRLPELTTVVNAIVQSEELGVSIGQILRIQGDMLRNKRFTLAEKLAGEAPVKIIPAIILFIFPAVLLILIVPIAMKIADVMQ